MDMQDLIPGLAFLLLRGSMSREVYVRLTDDEIERCRVFAYTSAQTQQAIEFGQKTTAERDKEEGGRDTWIGKIGEVIVAKAAEKRFGIHVDLDFSYYPRGQWDDQDFLINGWRIDVKAMREGARWLFVEWNKLCFRQQYHNLSHAYIAVSVGWDRDSDKPTGGGVIKGIASLDKLSTASEKTAVLMKGDLIPGTNTRLQADNYGIRFKDLSDFDRSFLYMLKHRPNGVAERFINPYEQIKH